MILDSARKVLRIEADSVREQIENVGPAFESAVEAMHSCQGRVVVTGMGKSGIVGQKIAATLASTGTPAFFLHPAEAIHGDLGMVIRGDVVLALSYSGETEEICRLLEFLKRLAIPLITMTGTPESTLARAADHAISVAISREACPLNLAPTASTTAMLAMGDALAMALSEKRGFREEDFAALHPGGKLGKKFLRVRDLMRRGDRIPRVAPETRMTDAVHEMSAKLMGITAVVRNDGTLCGAISDGDLRRLLQSDDRLLAKTAGECAHPNPRTIAEEEFASAALRRMEEAKITSLFVVDGAGRLIGALHLHDLWGVGLF
ncbi:MAG TPA: KpsF/GutQ family sugar-phosphate isomerase [Thermoanaerobaculia bacterium]|nr:KpsF/GutQ family sugar-phosphate isomerase [Thermoanaerobaculia bacterium]